MQGSWSGGAISMIRHPCRSVEMEGDPCVLGVDGDRHSPPPPNTSMTRQKGGRLPMTPLAEALRVGYVFFSLPGARQPGGPRVSGGLARRTARLLSRRIRKPSKPQANADRKPSPSLRPVFRPRQCDPVRDGPQSHAWRPLFRSGHPVQQLLIGLS